MTTDNPTEQDKEDRLDLAIKNWEAALEAFHAETNKIVRRIKPVIEHDHNRSTCEECNSMYSDGYDAGRDTAW